MKIHHIGYAVRDIEKSLKHFLDLGFFLESRTTDIERKINIAFISNNNTKIELIAPIEDGSPIDGILKNIGPSPYHICYEVSDIDVACKELKEKGWTVILKPAKAPAIKNKDNQGTVVFLYNKDIGIIELLELK